MSGNDYAISFSYVSGLDGLFRSDGSFDTTNTLTATSLPTGSSTANPIYLIASYTQADHNYVSTVLRTYDFTVADDAAEGFIIYKSAERADEHGFNIGFAAGHCDGTMQNVHVDDQTSGDSYINLNESVSGMTAVKHNSQYGLIGLISDNHQSNSLAYASGSDVVDYTLDPNVTTADEINATKYFTVNTGVTMDKAEVFGLYSDATSGYTNYYVSADKKFEFPSGSINVGSAYYYYPAFTFDYDISADNVAYNMYDFSNRTGEDRCIGFTSTGPGRFICLYASNNATNTKYMLMKDSTSVSEHFTGTVTASTDPDAYSSSHFYLGKNIIGGSTVSYISNSKDCLAFCYFDIPSAGSYYFGAGGAGYAEIAYMRFIYASDNGNSGGYTSVNLSDDVISTVEFATDYNSVSYLSGLRFAFRESDVSHLKFDVYFVSSYASWFIAVANSSSASEEITVTKYADSSQTAYTYPASAYIFVNQGNSLPTSTSGAYVLTDSAQVKFDVSSSTTSVVSVS